VAWDEGKRQKRMAKDKTKLFASLYISFSALEFFQWNKITRGNENTAV
jgi:hypothetical protein